MTESARKKRNLEPAIIPAQPGWEIFYHSDDEDTGLPVLAWYIDGHWGDLRRENDCEGRLCIHFPEPITISGDHDGTYALKTPNGNYIISEVGFYKTWEECKKQLIAEHESNEAFAARLRNTA